MRNRESVNPKDSEAQSIQTQRSDRDESKETAKCSDTATSGPVAGSSEQQAATPGHADVTAEEPAPTVGRTDNTELFSENLGIQEMDGAEALASLNTDQVTALCRIAMDADLTIQLNYEQKYLEASQMKLPTPKEPKLELQPAERQIIKQIAATPVLSSALDELMTLFQSAMQNGAEAMFSLPPPLPSLLPTDRARLNQIVDSPDQRIFYLQQSARKSAQSKGSEMPAPQPTLLGHKEQKAILRLLRDVRAKVYMSEVMSRGPEKLAIG